MCQIPSPIWNVQLTATTAAFPWANHFADLGELRHPWFSETPGVRKLLLLHIQAAAKLKQSCAGMRPLYALWQAAFSASKGHSRAVKSRPLSDWTLPYCVGAAPVAHRFYSTFGAGTVQSPLEAMTLIQAPWHGALTKWDTQQPRAVLLLCCFFSPHNSTQNQWFWLWLTSAHTEYFNPLSETI